MPSSSACRKSGTASRYGMGQPSRPEALSPKLMVPIPIRLIVGPEDPNRVYCISFSLQAGDSGPRRTPSALVRSQDRHAVGLWLAPWECDPSAGEHKGHCEGGQRDHEQR